MFFFTQHEIELFLSEDMPYHDLTSEALEISGISEITYVTRDPGVACGTEEVRKLAEVLGITVTDLVASGTRVQSGQSLLTATGDSAAVFALWKVAQNILDRCSGIATAAADWRTLLDGAGHEIPVLVTRKSFPGAKKLMVKAAVVGGAVMHRLGVSETMLFFDQHIEAVGGAEEFLAQLPNMKKKHIEKKLLVETTDQGFAEAALAAGADGIQYDKLSPSEVNKLTVALRDKFPGCVLLAAGGVTLDNCVAHASTGVDGLVTSAIYQAKPLDVGVKIKPVNA